MRIHSFKFGLQELGGALGDMGTLLPLTVGLIMVNGLNPTAVLAAAGLFYIGSGLYYRVPMPVQPLKVAAAIAISSGLPASVVGAAGLLMGIILLSLSLTNLATAVVKLFPPAVVRGIQLSIGVILLRRGVEFALSEQVFVSGTRVSADLPQAPLGLLLAASAMVIFSIFHFAKSNVRFPASLAVLSFGVVIGAMFASLPEMNKLGPSLSGMQLPTGADFWLAFTVLVIPQLPLTLGNAVVGTTDTARAYFNERARRVTPRALTASMGMANIAAGLAGAMPMCHGAGGLTAHYRLGARTGAANLMIGGLLLIAGLLFGSAALRFLSLIPLPVLGVLLAVVGVYHASLIGDLRGRKALAVAGTVGIVTIALGSLAYGFTAGILLHYMLRLDMAKARRWLSGGVGIRQEKTANHAKKVQAQQDIFQTLWRNNVNTKAKFRAEEGTLGPESRFRY